MDHQSGTKGAATAKVTHINSLKILLFSRLHRNILTWPAFVRFKQKTRFLFKLKLSCESWSLIKALLHLFWPPSSCRMRSEGESWQLLPPGQRRAEPGPPWAESQERLKFLQRWQSRDSDSQNLKSASDSDMGTMLRDVSITRSNSQCNK